ncbi:YhaN family protein [Salipiger aestuarii]|uniref:YhaN family protein n=1 Tax=Salipiger aestuarii TaxID=568098 RepID=UPI001238C29F|nr:YhaN family protein [Salipiger aestuarii]KAA8608262.1 hypothetical protein AL037_17435 [Salipiger aestuarii]
MRLRRLDLIRYGRFEDRVLDFGEAGDGPDVTLVFGENEAGKSTAFSAWLDLLYGLPLQHPYDFRFSRNELMVGAVLDTPDGPLTLRRTGKRHGSLTDEAGREVDEARLAGLLHGLDRDAFRTRFSLDDETLRRGGKDIADARGDLGQLLHAGSSGLSGLTETLAEAAREVDEFHKPRARKTTLAQTRAELARLDAAMAQARLDPRDYDRLRQNVTETQARYDAASQAQADATRALALRKAADARRALAGQIDRIDTDLQAFPRGPDLPADALSGVRVAAAAIRAARHAQAEAQTAEAAATDALAGLTPDPAGVEAAALAAEIGAAEFEDGTLLVTRVLAAEPDVDKLAKDLHDTRDAAAALAQTLGGPGAAPETVALSRAALATLREAAESARVAARDSDRAIAALADAEARLGPVETLPDGWQRLGDALDALPEDPAPLRDAAAQATADAARLAAGLPPGWDTLAAAGLPVAAELRQIETDAHSATAAMAEARDRLQEARDAHADAQARRTAEGQLGAVVTDAEIAATRARRDALWAEHSARLSARTAGAFETSMLADDSTRARHAATMEQRALLGRLGVEIDTLAARVARREASAASAAATARDVAARASGMAARLGLPEGTAPAAFAPRCDALRVALDAALAAAAAGRSLDTARRAHEAALDAVLAAALPLAPTAPTLPEARRLRADLEASAARIAQREKAGTLVADLRKTCEASGRAKTAAQAGYAQAVSGLWCETLAPPELLARLDEVARLREMLDDARGLARRVGQMQSALRGFDMRAGALRKVLDLPDAGPTELLREAARRGSEAERIQRETAAARDRQTRARADADNQGRLIAAARADIARLLDGQALPEDADPETQAQHLAARDALRARRRDAERQRNALAADHDARALALEEADADPARSVHLADALEAARTDRDAALETRAEARQALDSALRRTGAAELAQTRAALLETLREQARGAVLARVGLMAAQGALSRLREDRRGPMLTAAQHAFATVTGGEWPRLETRPGGTGEQLVGVRHDRKVPADAMSTGTRAQLYLALRIAGHADFTRRFGPLPFVTDDILETFDDTRAAATLEMTAGMGQLGQAIMFTHHAHLVALARERIAGLRVIALD